LTVFVVRQLVRAASTECYCSDVVRGVHGTPLNSFRKKYLLSCLRRCSFWIFTKQQNMLSIPFVFFSKHSGKGTFNSLNPELNPICYLLALLGAHHFLHVSRIRVKILTFRRLMSYIYMEHPFLMFLDHTQRRSTVGRTPLDE